MNKQLNKLDMDAIYAVRDKSVIRYNIIGSDEKTYSLRDTSCVNHDFCEIKISRGELDRVGSYSVGKNVEFLNDSAVRYRQFHTGQTFFLDEKDAKIEVDNRWIGTYKRLLDDETELRDRINYTIANLKKYLNKLPVCAETTEIGSGSHIYTYDVDKMYNEARKTYIGQTFSIEETLKSSTYDFIINDVYEIVRTKNGVVTNSVEMYIDNRNNEYSPNECDIYLRVKNVDGEIELSRIPFCDTDDNDIYYSEYCRGTRISHKGYRTLGECEEAIINEILEMYSRRMDGLLDSIKKHEDLMKEYIDSKNKLQKEFNF